MYRVGYAKLPTDHDDMKVRTGYVDKTIRIMHARHHRSLDEKLAPDYLWWHK